MPAGTRQLAAFSVAELTQWLRMQARESHGLASGTGKMPREIHLAQSKSSVNVSS